MIIWKNKCFLTAMYRRQLQKSELSYTTDMQQGQREHAKHVHQLLTMTLYWKIWQRMWFIHSSTTINKNIISVHIHDINNVMIRAKTNRHSKSRWQHTLHTTWQCHMKLLQRSFGVIESKRITAAHLETSGRLRIHMRIQFFWTWLWIIFCMGNSFVDFLLDLVIKCLCAQQQMHQSNDI